MEKRIARMDEYSISPESGRLRKRVRKKNRKFFNRKRVKKYVEYFLWAIVLTAFIYSLMVVIPELGITNTKKNPGRSRAR